MAKLAIGWALFWIAFGIATAVGWVINIVHILNHLHDPMTGEFIVRIVGIIATPIGAIMGYFF